MPKGQMIVNNPLHVFSIWCIHSFAVSFFTNIVKIRVLEHHGLVLRCLYAIDKHVCSSYFHHIHGIPFLVNPKVLYLVTTFVPIYQPLTPPLCGLCWSKNVCRFVYKSPWYVGSFLSLQCSHQHKPLDWCLSLFSWLLLSGGVQACPVAVPLPFPTQY